MTTMTQKESALRDAVERAKAKLAEGTLSANDLDEIGRVIVHAPSTGGKIRQRLMYLHASTPSIRSPVIGAAIHEPVQGSITQIDPLAPDLPYGTVFAAVLDGWRIIHFPQQLAPFDDREIDILGYEFVLEKLEVFND